jgi:hypothetical protein
MDQERDDYADPVARRLPSLRTLAVVAVCGTACLLAVVAFLFTLLLILYPPVLRD